jgi:hypothetical protein
MKNLLPALLLAFFLIACGDETAESGDEGADTTVVDVDINNDDVDDSDDSLVGSGSFQGEDSLVQREVGDKSPEIFEGTIMELAGGGKRYQGEMPILMDVRTGYHEGYDRIVFEFSGQGMPGWQTEYIDKPAHECGSGNQRFLAGDAWLEVRMDGTAAHTDAGEPTITHRNRKLKLPNIKELALTCDFEATVTWVMGLSSPEQYRAVELENPTRLVIDVRHPSNFK